MVAFSEVPGVLLFPSKSFCFSFLSEVLFSYITGISTIPMWSRKPIPEMLIDRSSERKINEKFDFKVFRRLVWKVCPTHMQLRWLKYSWMFFYSVQLVRQLVLNAWLSGPESVFRVSVPCSYVAKSWTFPSETYSASYEGPSSYNHISVEKSLYGLLQLNLWWPQGSRRGKGAKYEA